MTFLTTWLPRLLGGVVALFGLVLLIGGSVLIVGGGSAYFALMGLATTTAGVMLTLRRRMGAWLYGAAFAATVVWALAEVDADFWPLVSRLVMPAVLALAVPRSTRWSTTGGAPAGRHGAARAC